MNIIFCGFFCAGKSTYGRECAALLQRPFFDTDQEIEAISGSEKNVRQIWTDEGESRFRELEREVVRALASRRGCVISTGGSTLVVAENQRLLKGCGSIIYLYSPFDTLMGRIEKRGFPASIDKRDPKSACLRAFNERDPLFRSLADLTIETTGCTSRALVDLLSDFL